QRDDGEALALEAGEDLAGQAAGEGIRLDQDQGPAHRGSLRVRFEWCPAWVRGVCCCVLRACYCVSATSSTRRRRERRGAAAVASTSVSQYGQTLHIGSSGLPQLRHGSFSLRMQFGQRRKSFSTSKSQCGQRW